MYKRAIELENLGRYTNRFKEKGVVDESELNNIVFLNLIISKLKQQHNLKNNSEVAKLIGCGEGTLIGMLNGKNKITTTFIKSLCFTIGISKKQMVELSNMSSSKLLLDEYVNGNNHLIVNGMDIGKVGDEYEI